MIMLKRLYEKYGSNISMNWNNVAIYNNVNTTSPLWKKTSLTNDELDELVETHFPKGYTFTINSFTTDGCVQIHCQTSFQ